MYPSDASPPNTTLTCAAHGGGCFKQGCAKKKNKRHLKIISYVIISKGEEEEECDENIIVYRYNAT